MPNVNRAVFSSASAEWYTPPDLLAEIRVFMGAIDYDPCPARAEDEPFVDGLRTSWRGRVFCNPPYGRGIGAWIDKALTEPVKEIVLLVPARTDTHWFAPLFAHTLCFVRGRLRFSGHQDSAPFPSALVYRGRRRNAFAQTFAQRGAILSTYGDRRPDTRTIIVVPQRPAARARQTQLRFP